MTSVVSEKLRRQVGRRTGVRVSKSRRFAGRGKNILASKKRQMCESDFSRAGGSAFRHVASSRPSFKCPPAALPGAFVDFSQKSREISALATSQRGVIFELSPSQERNFPDYVFVNVFFEIVLIL